MTAGAYMSTPYIKIRGKIYAFHVRDSQPDPIAGRHRAGYSGPGL
jgi:hypothetical protein